MVLQTRSFPSHYLALINLMYNYVLSTFHCILSLIFNWALQRANLKPMSRSTRIWYPKIDKPNSTVHSTIHIERLFGPTLELYLTTWQLPCFHAHSGYPWTCIHRKAVKIQSWMLFIVYGPIRAHFTLHQYRCSVSCSISMVLTSWVNLPRSWRSTQRLYVQLPLLKRSRTNSSYCLRHSSPRGPR